MTHYHTHFMPPRKVSLISLLFLRLHDYYYRFRWYAKFSENRLTSSNLKRRHINGAHRENGDAIRLPCSSRNKSRSVQYRKYTTNAIRKIN